MISKQHHICIHCNAFTLGVPLYGQAYGSDWVYQTRGWTFIAFNPATFSTPIAMNNMAQVGLDMSSLDWSAVNLEYYNTSRFLADVSAAWPQEQGGGGACGVTGGAGVEHTVHG